ncbi:16S rRNA (cytidine(1402)-2'-O)-methyltransferase, partial [bacterium]|nr:16S rRNA (cytidine(1402)-2'-O)-methyltransferase [bacterium]
MDSISESQIVISKNGDTSCPVGLTLVATPIGNLADVSHRALAILKTADIVLCEDTRRTQILLQRYGINAKLLSYGVHNLKARIPQVLKKLQEDARIALVSDAGTPGISDPGAELCRRALDMNVQVYAIPGPAAFVQALVLSGLPTSRFIFEGFLPHKKGRQTRLKSLADEPRTIILYESPHRLIKTLEQLHEYLGNRSIAVARELTKLHEEIVRGKLTDVIENFSSREK